MRDYRRHLRMDRIRAKRTGEMIQRVYYAHDGLRIYQAMPDGEVRRSPYLHW